MDVRIGFIQMVGCALVSHRGVSIALSRLDKIGTGALAKGSNVEADLDLRNHPAPPQKAPLSP